MALCLPLSLAGGLKYPSMSYKNILSCSLFALLLLPGCAGLAGTRQVGMQTIETRVDSEAARYYLENYLTGKHIDDSARLSVSITFIRAPMAICPTAASSNI